MANRVTPFSIGQRWYCDCEAKGRPSFTFVIIGVGDKHGEKRCRLEYENPGDRRAIPQHGHESVYSHKHLKKYAVLVTLYG